MMAYDDIRTASACCVEATAYRERLHPPGSARGVSVPARRTDQRLLDDLMDGDRSGGRASCLLERSEAGSYS